MYLLIPTNTKVEFVLDYIAANPCSEEGYHFLCQQENTENLKQSF